ncbi:MAG: ABC transporter ATP-binding protein [Methanomethylophilus sp.]
MKIDLRNLCQGYGKTEILHGLNASLDTGQVIALLGPNGSGKSTLIRTMSGLMTPTSGNVLLNGKNLQDISLAERAKLISYVPQSFSYMPYTTVLNTVLAGRNPHMGWEPSETDLNIVARSLDIMGLGEFAERNINELSGGQRQRVFIARALSQTPVFFLFDEPTSSLDMKYQLETMKKMYSIVHDQNVGLIIALHDINLAMRYADRVILVRNGRIFAEGAPYQVITESSILNVYGVKTTITENEHGRFILAYDSV